MRNLLGEGRSLRKSSRAFWEKGFVTPSRQKVSSTPRPTRPLPSIDRSIDVSARDETEDHDHRRAEEEGADADEEEDQGDALREEGDGLRDWKEEE